MKVAIMQPLSIVDLYPHTEPTYLQTNLESFLLLRYGVGILVQSQWVTRVWGYLMQLTCALWSCVDLIDHIQCKPYSKTFIIWYILEFKTLMKYSLYSHP